MSITQKKLTPKQQKYFKPYEPKHGPSDWATCRTLGEDVELFQLPIATLYLEMVGKPWPGKMRRKPITWFLSHSYETLTDELGVKPKDLDLIYDFVERVARTEKGDRDMVESKRIVRRTEESFLNTLTRFGIRTDLPLDFIAIDAETRSECLEQEAKNLGKVLHFGMALSEKKKLKGDLLELMNAISAESENILSRFLPIEEDGVGVSATKAMEIAVEAIPAKDRVPALKFLRNERMRRDWTPNRSFEETCELLKRVSRDFQRLFPAVFEQVNKNAKKAGDEGESASFPNITDPVLRRIAEELLWNNGEPHSTDKEAGGGGFLRKHFSFRSKS